MSQDRQAQQQFLSAAGIELPIIGGPMYPCSNPELVAAVSQAGGIGIVQPITLTYVFGYELRAGLRAIRALTDKPIGMNVLIEQAQGRYRQRMEAWIEIALEEGIRFFITSLGKPDWVVDKVHSQGAVVYHDVTEKKWAQKGVDCGIDGLIAVNKRAGGHAGRLDARTLLDELREFDLPVICAGGIGDERAYVEALEHGYAGVQMGTRLIASLECSASEPYKQAIIKAQEQDIVLSERITGVPVSVIQTDYIRRMGLRAGPVARFLLRNNRSKHLMRLFYTLRSGKRFKNSLTDKELEFWQAGKSAAAINTVESVAEIVKTFRAAAGQ